LGGLYFFVLCSFLEEGEVVLVTLGCQLQRLVFILINHGHTTQVEWKFTPLRRDLTTVPLLGRIKDVSLLAEKDVAPVLVVLHNLRSSSSILDSEGRVGSHNCLEGLRMGHELRAVLVCAVRELLTLQILIAHHRCILNLRQHSLLTETAYYSTLVSLRRADLAEVLDVLEVAAKLAI
jgi:hypothetical protein